MHKHLHSTLVLMWRKWCPGRDLNPHSPCGEKDFKSFASADFATRAWLAARIPILVNAPFPTPHGFFAAGFTRINSLSHFTCVPEGVLRPPGNVLSNN